MKPTKAFFIFSTLFSTAISKQTTNVINQISCQDCEHSASYLAEVPTYAELSHDPRAALPDSFTICSAAMYTIQKSQNYSWFMFFNLLGKDGNQILAAFFNDKGFYLTETAPDTVPVFPHHTPA